MLIVILTLVLALNLWLSLNIIRANIPGVIKAGWVILVWFVPLVGALLVWSNLRELTPRESLQARPKSRGCIDEAAPTSITLATGESFDVLANMAVVNGVPLMDWRAFHDWQSALASDVSRQQATDLGKRAWLLHMRDAIGEPYELYGSDQTYVLAATDPAVVEATTRFIAKTRERIARVLPDLANFQAHDKSVLLMLDSEDTYYHYTTTYYPDEGEFALSSGMFIPGGCAHFVVAGDSLSHIEPVIVHELTHSALAHLHLPTWIAKVSL